MRQRRPGWLVVRLDCGIVHSTLLIPGCLSVIQLRKSDAECFDLMASSDNGGLARRIVATWNIATNRICGTKATSGFAESTTPILATPILATPILVIASTRPLGLKNLKIYFSS